jgi:predicted DNA-binding transcriptional regulator AlpA
MPTKRNHRAEVDFEYLSAPQVCARYGGRSHMWLERLLQNDPNFPRPMKMKGRGMRFFKVADLVKYERAYFESAA